MIVIGLGNPGITYKDNRHNVGFRVVDFLAGQHNQVFKKRLFRPYAIASIRIAGQHLYLVKPLTFMNRSGAIIKDVLKKTRSRVDDLLIICDNLDLPPGTCRLKTKGSSAGQKGLTSIIETLGTPLFKRIYIGIGRPAPGATVIEHVLGNPGAETQAAIDRSVQTAAEGVLMLLQEPVEKVMGLINNTNHENQQNTLQNQDS